MAGYEDMTTEQLKTEAAAMLAEVERREAEDPARAAVDAAVQAYADQQGLTVLQAWRALAPEDVDVPDDPEPEPAPDAPEWEQRYGHNAYQVGDLVTYNGKVYRNVWAGNTYTPEAYPQGWEEVG